MGNHVHTLAQSETNASKDIKLISGKGVNVRDTTKARALAKRKYVSQQNVKKLIKVAESRPDDKLLQKFWNAYHCLENVTIHKGRMYGKYCKQRFCTVCSSNRKAELINKYYPIVQNWEDAHFITS